MTDDGDLNIQEGWSARVEAGIRRLAMFDVEAAYDLTRAIVDLAGAYDERGRLLVRSNVADREPDAGKRRRGGPRH